MSDSRSTGWVRFCLANHLWNVHRVADTRRLELSQLSAIHRYFNCPVGPVAHNFACRFRFVPRRSPVRKWPTLLCARSIHRSTRRRMADGACAAASSRRVTKASRRRRSR